jgi:hypothetical protein
MKADITVCFVHVCDDGRFYFTKPTVQRKQEGGRLTVNMFAQASFALQNMSSYLDVI